MKRRLPVLPVLSVAVLLAVFPAQSSLALPAPQGAATEAVVTLEADGVAPFDATTFDPGSGVNAGTDGDGVNGVVRNFDAVTYNVEVSLNDAADTNLLATVSLNDKASWAAVPAECRTVALGFAGTPDSSISDSTGNGLFDTLVCNLGDRSEGTKVAFKAVANASGNNADVMSASVLSSSDNNTNLDGGAGTQGDGPVETVITAGFGINLSKQPCGLPERNARPNETDCDVAYHPAESLAVGAPEVKVLPWHVTLGYDAGSEFVADNGAGTQDFTITDTWVGTHSDDPSVEGDNAAGDFDDGIVLAGSLTGNPADSCRFASASAAGSVTCNQAGPGEPVTIQLAGIPVNQQPLAKIVMDMAIGYPDVFEPNGSSSETYSINNTATLTAWGGTGSLVTSGSGTVDPGPETDTEDFLVNNTIVGPLAFYKSFDGLSRGKSGQRAAAPGDTVETSLAIADYRTHDERTGVCDTIDTSVFEFGGNIGAGQVDGINHGGSGLFGADRGQANPVHYKFNPQLAVYQGVDNLGTGVSADALAYGVAVEFSDVGYAATGDDHWTATCQDDLTGDSVSDWVTDYSLLPGDASSVVRVRMVWDRDASQVFGLVPNANTSRAVFSFDLVLRPDAPIGERLPNTAATMRTDDPLWDGPDGWSGTTNPALRFYNVEDDPTNPLFSFNTTNADRVLVLPAAMSITKVNNPTALVPLVAGDVALFTIDPNVSGSGPDGETMTFTDTLPRQLAYSGDDCAAAYAAAGLTCTVSVAGQVVTWTVAGYSIGDDLPAFGLDSVVLDGTPAGTYTNTVVIDSSWANLSDDSHCDDAVDSAGDVTDAAIAQCERLFTRPHSDSASVLVLSDTGVRVEKVDDAVVVEPGSLYTTRLSYINLGGGDVGIGQVIDVLPYNGDGLALSNYSPQRFNPENPTNANTSTSTSDPDGAVDFVSVTASSAGETFEYSTDPHNTIDHRPCHPDNWPAGDTETTNVTIGAVCERGLINPATDVPTIGQPGTGATTWGPLPAAASDVTAIRASTPVFPGGEGRRDITLNLNTALSHDGDLFCNNFGANAGIITLDIISNDVCVEVVAGSISDYIWQDANSDGVQDPAEAPLPNIGVSLLVEDPTNPGSFIPFQVQDPENPGLLVDYTATTGPDGKYLFENLPSGNYQVVVDPTTIPPHAEQTFDNQGPLDHMSNVTLFGPNNPGAPGTSPIDVTDNLDQDFGYYVFEPEPAIDIEKATNGVQSDTAPGEPVLTGSAVTWTYVVTNTGNTALTNVDVSDSDPAVLLACDLNADGDFTNDGAAANPFTAAFLAPTAKLTCQATGTAGAADYQNIATATGDPIVPNVTPDQTTGNPTCDCDLADPTTWPTDPDDYQPAADTANRPLPAVIDTDPSRYRGIPRTFDLALTKNLAPDTPTIVNVGDPVTYTLTVTNEGQVEAMDVEITDTLPAALTLNDSDWTSGANNTAKYTIEEPITPGTTATIEITVTVTGIGDLRNAAEITKTTPSINGSALPVDLIAGLGDVDSSPGNNSGTEDDEDTAILTVAAKSTQATTPAATTPLAFTGINTPRNLTGGLALLIGGLALIRTTKSRRRQPTPAQH